MNNNNDKVIYQFLEKNLVPKFDMLLKKVNEYLSEKHGVVVAVDLTWIIQRKDNKEGK